MAASGVSTLCPYLRSCEQESAGPVSGEVTGEIPKWLKGSLIRVGCGLLEVGSDRYKHVFDGLALLHRFSFDGGMVTYQNRFLRSDTYRKNRKANRIVVSEFGTRAAPDPCKSIFQRFLSLFTLDFSDNDLVNIVLYSNEVYACSEVNCIWRIDPENLESINKVNLSDFVAINTATAHPHTDTDGTIYNVGSSFGIKSGYTILKFPPKEGKESSPFQGGSVVCKIPISSPFRPSYYHSFGMTENYFVFVEQPLYLSLTSIAWSHFVAGAYADALQWKRNQNIFHVVRRADGRLLPTRYVAPYFFTFHHINAYEDERHLVVDMCCYEDGDVIKSMYVQALEDMCSSSANRELPFVSSARRYVLPLDLEDTVHSTENLVTLANSKAKASRQNDGSILCDPEYLIESECCSMELPRINYEKFNGKKYQFFYAISPETLSRAKLVKVDVRERTAIYWREDAVIPSEPVFIAEPESEDEDSGIVLASLLYTGDERKVSILVLNARTMKEIGRVNFKTEASVPRDFHGTFITQKAQT